MALRQLARGAFAQVLKQAVVTDAAQSSFASHVRAALTSDHQRVHALLSGLEDLEFGGSEDDPGFANLKAWRELQTRKLNALPEDFTETGVGTAWHDLVHDPDPKRGYRTGNDMTATSNTAEHNHQQPKIGTPQWLDAEKCVDSRGRQGGRFRKRKILHYKGFPE